MNNILNRLPHLNILKISLGRATYHHDVLCHHILSSRRYEKFKLFSCKRAFAKDHYLKDTKRQKICTMCFLVFFENVRILQVTTYLVFDLSFNLIYFVEDKRLLDIFNTLLFCSRLTLKINDLKLEGIHCM